MILFSCGWIKRESLECINMDISCPVCTSESVNTDLILSDDRYGYSKQFNIQKCTSCNHQFISSNFEYEFITWLYSKYYPRSQMSVDDYKPSPSHTGFVSWFNGENRSPYCYVPENVTVLDIGCGFGETLGYHTKRGCDVYGVEADQNIKRVADKYGFKVKVGLFDTNDYPAEFFHYITMDQVLEHMVDPVDTLKGISRILKPNGQVIISIPNPEGWGIKVFGKKWINWHIPYHIHHFSQKSIEIAADKAGLYIENVRTVTSSEWLFYQWVHLFTTPIMGKPSVFWCQKVKRNIRDKIIMYIITAIHFTKINHIITRIFDLMGMGDSKLYFIRKE